MLGGGRYAPHTTHGARCYVASHCVPNLLRVYICVLNTLQFSRLACCLPCPQGPWEKQRCPRRPVRGCVFDFYGTARAPGPRSLPFLPSGDLAGATGIIFRGWYQRSCSMEITPLPVFLFLIERKSTGIDTKSASLFNLYRAYADLRPHESEQNTGRGNPVGRFECRGGVTV
eukprot:gene14397-biopygen6580